MLHTTVLLLLLLLASNLSAGNLLCYYSFSITWMQASTALVTT
jgi:hypothetical protein